MLLPQTKKGYTFCHFLEEVKWNSHSKKWSEPKNTSVFVPYQTDGFTLLIFCRKVRKISAVLFQKISFGFFSHFLCADSQENLKAESETTFKWCVLWGERRWGFPITTVFDKNNCVSPMKLVEIISFTIQWRYTELVIPFATLQSR